MNDWYIYCKKADFAAISEKFHISPMTARILVNRGINTDEDIRAFFEPDIYSVYDPFLFKDMKNGVDIALNAISQNERILVIGDYDVDGICSSYILKSGIEFLGGSCDVRLPNRVLDGYGMNSNMVIDAAEQEVSLIITCDNGISAVEPVALAKQKGIKVIVTDHHEPPDILPAADAIIDAKREDNTYPFRELCGASVTYKFVQALFKASGMPAGSDVLLEKLILFAGIATITDIVPLLDENRYFAKNAITKIKTNDNLGLKSLMSVKGIEPENIKSYHIGFIIGPCINSAGRLKDAQIGFDLLSTDNQTKALEIANELYSLNEERKNLTLSQTKAAESIIADCVEKKGDLDKVIVIYLPEAHESVAGIIAGRLKEEYSHPAIVITDSEEGLKGSGRSVDSYDMIAALRRHEDLLKKYGGHAKAAGFSLNCTVSELSDALNSDPELSDISFDKKIWIDMQLPFKYVTESFMKEMVLLEPFGTSNEKPLFAEKNVSFSEVKLFGNNHNVLKLKMTNVDGDSIEGVKFGHGQSFDDLYERINNVNDITQSGYVFSITYFPGINEYRNNKYIQAIIEDIKFPECYDI